MYEKGKETNARQPEHLIVYVITQIKSAYILKALETLGGAEVGQLVHQILHNVCVRGIVVQ